jgi:hypothetical protein
LTVETLWPHFETLKLSEKSSAVCFRPSSALKLDCCQQFPVARCKTFQVSEQLVITTLTLNKDAVRHQKVDKMSY